MRRLLATVLVTLGLLVGGGSVATAAADDDPGMTHDGTCRC